MAEKQELEFAGSVEPHAAAAYLELLAKGLRDGSVLLESGDKSVDLEVGSEVDFELEAESTEKGKHSLDIKLSWRILAPVPEPVAPSLVIASGPAVSSEDDVI